MIRIIGYSADEENMNYTLLQKEVKAKYPPAKQLWHKYSFRGEIRYYKNKLTMIDPEITTYLGESTTYSDHWKPIDKDTLMRGNPLDKGDGIGFDGPIYNIDTPVVKKPLKVEVKRPKVKQERWLNKRCCYCNIALNADNFTREHIVPVSRGGKSGKNIKPCCEPCNTEKADMMLHTYIQYLNLMVLEYPIGSDPYKTTQRKIINANEIAKSFGKE